MPRLPDFYGLLLSAPVLITIQRGEEMRLELLNLLTRKSVGDEYNPGKRLSEALPEFERWLRRIAEGVQSGERRIGVEEPVTLD